METIRHIEKVNALVKTWHYAGENVAFVPTMGNLHSGHLELVHQAKIRAKHVVASIFVNPLQFGPLEDFAAYPRTLAEDKLKLEQIGIDLLFTPEENELYPHGQETHTRVEVPKISNILCGSSRPGHFAGVATIVCKLLNIVQPDIGLFGEKDFQQLLIIKRMVADLGLPVEIIGVPTVREPDGLAMSSRNGYLSREERAKAPVLYRSLQTAVQGLQQGLAPLRVETRVYQDLRSAGLRPDYVKVRRATDLAEAGPNDHALVILAAAYLGKTRLIDNLQVPETPDSRAGQ